MKSLWFLILAMFPFAAFAEEAAHAAAASSGWAYPFAAVGFALAVMAAATAQGRIGASYMDGVSRNPGAQKVMFTPLILSLIFVETLVLFTVLVALMVLGKI